LIASRKLQFTSRDNATRRDCTVGITAPREEAPREAIDGVRPDPLAVCEVVFDGLSLPAIQVHGADSLQAIALAADIDTTLRGLEREHGLEFFWDDGSAYFPQER
jgi:hypothetical protein